MSSEPRRLLLVHAHPDDESITTGGTIARYLAEGAEVTVVTCTLGEEGEVIPDGLNELGSWAGDQLGGYRHGELSAALAALGGPRRHYLGGLGRWRDSGMADAATGHPRAFVAGSLEHQAGQLAALLEELRPQVVVSYNAFGGYGHPDHIRAHEITMAAAPGAGSVRRVFHTVSSTAAVTAGLAWLRERQENGERVPWRIAGDGELSTVPDTGIGTVLDIREQLPAKRAALRAHASQVQVAPDDSCFALSDAVAQPLPEAEYFVGAHGAFQGADTDLFGGL